MTVDFGRQVGPLPLGAWLAVVAGGLGIAWYTTKTRSPIEVEDGSGAPGVGTGAPAPWTPITGTPSDQQPGAPTTNEQWAVKAISWLIGQGYPPTQSDSAVRKYISGTKMSVQETTLIGIVLVAIGPPPQVLPPVEEEPGDPEPEPKPKPDPPKPPPIVVPQYVSVPIEENLYQWVDRLNAQYGLSLTFVRMFGLFPYDPTALNPEARKYMRWDGSGTLTPVFTPYWANPGKRSGKYIGIPPMRIK